MFWILFLVAGAQFCGPAWNANNTALSVVFAGRNDNYVGIRDRMKMSVTVLAYQLNYYATTDFRAEIVLVNWGVIDTEPSMMSILDVNKWGVDLPYVCIRVIRVPTVFVSYKTKFPFSEFVAKNVGLRRARGKWLATMNLDNFVSMSVFRLLFQGRFPENSFVRTRRTNINIAEGTIWWRRGQGYVRERALPQFASAFDIYSWLLRAEMSESGFPIDVNAMSLYSHNDVLCGDKTISDVSVVAGWETEYSAAAGDFILAPRNVWGEMAGFPEVFENNHLDGLQLCRFMQRGVLQIVLRIAPPCSATVFHQYHLSGRSRRRERNIGRVSGCSREKGIETRLRQYVNRTNWGYYGERFDEHTISGMLV